MEDVLDPDFYGEGRDRPRAWARSILVRMSLPHLQDVRSRLGTSCPIPGPLVETTGSPMLESFDLASREVWKTSASIFLEESENLCVSLGDASLWGRSAGLVLWRLHCSNEIFFGGGLYSLPAVSGFVRTPR